MKKILGLILGIGTVFGLCACEKKNNTITIAEVTHSPFYAPQYVAMSEGFFEDYGLDVDIVLASGADKVMASLLSHDAEIGLMGPEASIYVYNQGKKDYALSFAQLTQKDGSFLLGREMIDDFSLSMLEGKSIIAGRKGGMPLMVLESILKSNNLDVGVDNSEASINLRSDIQFSAMSGAFVSGEGDFVSLFEPNASMLVKEGKGHILASLGELSGNIPYTCYSSLSSYIKKNKKKLNDFTLAIKEAQKWCYSHTPLEIATSIKEFFVETSLEELTTFIKNYQDIKAWALDPVLTKESFDKLQDIIISSGEISKRVPYEELVVNLMKEE